MSFLKAKVAKVCCKSLSLGCADADSDLNESVLLAVFNRLKKSTVAKWTDLIRKTILVVVDNEANFLSRVFLTVLKLAVDLDLVSLCRSRSE